ncbi:MAG TPA: hypothetical protein VM597_40050 [Gemmataceae bacterium]|nr:hypothetical protein [Gemmataceae bacterium]
MALWVGRRHHVPVGTSLKLIDQHYRKNVGADGGWTYSPHGGSSSPAMTCAGLIGLVVAHGAKLSTEQARDARPGADQEALLADPVVAGALKYVGMFVHAAANNGPDPGAGYPPKDLHTNLYFLWSLERVGMAFGLTKVGNVDWYEWGSRSLVQQQQPDGSWKDGGHAGPVSVENATAFALLFLSRANAAQDLSARLTGRSRDPSTSSLQSGELPATAAKAGPEKKAEGSTTVKTPPAPPADPAVGLADALVRARPADRAALLAKYRDTKGPEYTDALVLALADLRGEAVTEARDALAQRLTRMTPATLVGLMGAKDRELRRAAALASAAKGRERMKEFADALLGLIGDNDPLVVQAARAALKQLSGADHGPDTAATAADRQRALLAWRQWWEGQK